MLSVGRVDLARDALEASALAERSMVTGMTGRACELAEGGIEIVFDLVLGGDTDRPVNRRRKDAKPPEDFCASVRADREDCVVVITGRGWDGTR